MTRSRDDLVEALREQLEQANIALSAYKSALPQTARERDTTQENLEASQEREQALRDALETFLRAVPTFTYSKEAHYTPRSLEILSIDVDGLVQALKERS